MAFMDIKLRPQYPSLFERRQAMKAKPRMTKYPSYRPLPIAKKGQQFTAAEKELADWEYRQKYHLNKDDIDD